MPATILTTRQLLRMYGSDIHQVEPRLGELDERLGDLDGWEKLESGLPITRWPLSESRGNLETSGAEEFVLFLKGSVELKNIMGVTSTSIPADFWGQNDWVVGFALELAMCMKGESRPRPILGGWKDKCHYIAKGYRAALGWSRVGPLGDGIAADELYWVEFKMGFDGPVSELRFPTGAAPLFLACIILDCFLPPPLPVSHNKKKLTPKHPCAYCRSLDNRNTARHRLHLLR